LLPVSFFGGKLAAAPFGTFATISARSGIRTFTENSHRDALAARLFELTDNGNVPVRAEDG
jgi:hypothetical protein